MRVLSDDLIDSANDASQRFNAGERDAVLPFATGFSNWTPEDGDGQRNNEFVSLQKKEFKTLATDPLLGAIAAKLKGSATIRVLDDQLIYKPSNTRDASSTITGWHADRAYWATCSSEKLITAWIPLQVRCRKRWGRSASMRAASRDRAILVETSMGLVRGTEEKLPRWYELTIDYQCLRTLAKTVREAKWNVTVSVSNDKEIIAVQPGYHEDSYGAAVDIGSTTVALYLCNLRTGELLAAESEMNPQIVYGEDVMSLIQYTI